MARGCRRVRRARHRNVAKKWRAKAGKTKGGEKVLLGPDGGGLAWGTMGSVREYDKQLKAVVAQRYAKTRVNQTNSRPRALHPHYELRTAPPNPVRLSPKLPSFARVRREAAAVLNPHVERLRPAW